MPRVTTTGASMSTTNTLTAQAATMPGSTLSRPLLLLGVFTSSDTARALVRKDGASVMLHQDVPEGALTLIGTGDGWALIRDGEALHRLVIG